MKENKETFYFSHDYNTRSDIKIKKLIVKHGYEGYGLFWALIEDLYQNENLLPLDYECIAFDLRTNAKIIKSIINDFDLFDLQENTFSSLSVQRRLDIRNRRSKKARRSAKKRWNNDANASKNDANALNNDANALKNDANAMRLQCNRNAIKESKVKDNKVKESKVNSIVDTEVSMSDVAHPTQEKINYRSLIQFFNDETQGAFGKVRYPISKKRMGSIRARIKEFGVAGFEEMVQKASQSNFLRGDGKKGFIASFDWMIRPSNFQKVLEGNYDNKNNYNTYNNETDRRDSESAKRKEDFYKYAQSVGMVGREEKQNTDPIW